jgi:hypothetical protein
VPHYLYEIYPPSKNGTVVEWLKLAVAQIKEIWAKGKLPVVVGGTGLYIDNLINGTTPILLNRQGKGSKIGCFIVEDDDKVRVKTTNGSVLIDADGGISTFDSNGIETVRIKPDEISVDDLPDAQTLGAISNGATIATITNTAYTMDKIAQKVVSTITCDSTGEYVVQVENSNKKDIIISATLTAPSTLANGVTLNVGVFLIDSDNVEQQLFLTSNTITSSGSSTSLTATLEQPYLIRRKVNLVEGKTYRLVYRCECPQIGLATNSVKNATLTIKNSSSSGSINNYLLKQTSKTIIGNNGIMIAQNVLSYFFANIKGVDYLDLSIRGLPINNSNLVVGQLYENGDGIIRIKK